MPHHIHTVSTPSDLDGLSRTFRDVHCRYTGYINVCLRVIGHLWQGRFSTVAMDEEYLYQTVGYFALNPVRARVGDTAEGWAWSSTHALIAGEDDHVVTVAPTLYRVGDCEALLSQEFDDALSCAVLRKAESASHPIGPKDWLAAKETRTGLRLAPQRRMPKPKARPYIGTEAPA